MNQRDTDNLTFLMTASEDVFRHWYDQASIDDLDYACELLADHEKQLDAQFGAQQRQPILAVVTPTAGLWLH